MKIAFFVGSAVLFVACGGESPPASRPVAPPLPTPAEAARPAVSATAEAPAPKLSKAELSKMTYLAMQAAANAHDVKAIRSLYAADAVKQTPMPEGWKEVKGHDELEKQAARMFALAPDAAWKSVRTVQKGDVVASEYVANATRDGKKMGVRGVEIFWFDDEGKVKKERIYIDQLTMMIQTGRAPGKAPEPVALPSGDPSWIAGKGDAAEDELVATYESGWPAAWSKKDRKAYEALLADDFVQDDVAWGMTFKGKTEAGKGMESFTKAVPDVAITVDSAWAAGDTVVAEITMKGTHKGQLGPMKATNKPFTAHLLNVADYRDGKLVRSNVYMNSVEMLGQLGLVPKPDDSKKK